MYMLGQNSSFNQTKSTSVNNNFPSNTSGSEAITSGGNVNVAEASAKKPVNKNLFIGLGVAVAIIAIGVSAYFLFFKNADKSSSEVKVTEGVSASGPNASTDIQKQLDAKIASSATEQEAIDARFSKASFMIMDEDFDSALALLNEITPSSLSDYDQYRLYNYYTTVYQNLGNEAEVENYQKLAEEAHERDMASYKPE